MKERCTENGISLSEYKGDPPLWATARLENELVLGFLSWGFLMKNLNAISGDIAPLEVYQLSGLVRKLEEELLQPLQADELLTTSDQQRNQFREIVRDLAQILSQSESFSSEDYGEGRGPGYYRRYGTFLGRKNWCIEYNEHNASRHEYSLLWLCGPWDEKFNDIVNEDDGDSDLVAFRDKERLLIPLIIPPEAEKTVIMESLLDQIDRAGSVIG